MITPAEPLRTHADRILAELWRHPTGASDAQLATILGVRHQTINANCLKMAARGVIARGYENGTVINRALLPERPHRAVNPPMGTPWSWEGNVQAAVKTFLVEEGWTVVQTADTATKEQGTDIVLQRAGIPLWVTVKGLPIGTTRTQPYTQARHYFAGALLDIVLWRQEAPRNAQFAVALPVFSTYQRLAKRSRWLQETAPFDFLWVSEGGEVRHESGRPPTP